MQTVKRMVNWKPKIKVLCHFVTGNFTVWSFRKLKEQKLVRKSVIIVGIDPKDELQQLMVEDVIGPAQRCFAVSSQLVIKLLYDMIYFFLVLNIHWQLS